MHIHDIGIGMDSVDHVHPLRHLEQRLGEFCALGFALVEIDPHPFHLIIDGELHAPSLANWLAVLKQFPLRYSLHGLMRLNLAYDLRHELCCHIMLAQIELCRQIGASTLVYHSGLQALDAARYGVTRSLLPPQELAAGAEREVRAFRELAPVAADAGVIIGMENGDSHQWEHDLIARFGLPRAAISRHHARLHVEPIVRQLEGIGHPNVAMTLDVGHLYIAARDIGFDYLQAVDKAAPWVKHLHISDNFGRLDQGFDTEHDRWALGEADIHMPPGWGSVPLDQVFARLPDYAGDVILEIKTGFMDHAGEGLQTTRAILHEGT
jgi:sugar phosphate isomerase/epimerase